MNKLNREDALKTLRTARISPSLLSANLLDLNQEIAAISAEISCLHIDVMDGHYVPNLTFGPGLIASLAKHFFGILDVHLMVTNPEETWEMYREAGANVITFHPEATRHPDRLVQAIKAANCVAGIAVNPGTSLESVAELISVADLILIMSVNPGFGGQSFIPSSHDKIKRLKKTLGEKKSLAIIEVDGGVTEKNSLAIYASGADLLVAGSAVFSAKDKLTALRNIKKF